VAKRAAICNPHGQIQPEIALDAMGPTRHTGQAGSLKQTTLTGENCRIGCLRG
jgi:hypothetical protein